MVVWGGMGYGCEVGVCKGYRVVCRGYGLASVGM